MIEELFKVLEVGLGLWDHKDAEKYLDKVIDLRRRHREESNKADSERSDAVIDNVEFELRLVSLGFAAQAGKQNAPTQP